MASKKGKIIKAVNPDPDPGLVSRNFFFNFFNQKLQFTYPWASIKDTYTQATREAINPQKRTSGISKPSIQPKLLDPDPELMNHSKTLAWIHLVPIK
jgi:hypothetical protein